MILTFFMSFRFDMQKENATSLQAAGGHRFRTKKGAKTTRTGYIIRLLKETNTIFPCSGLLYETLHFPVTALLLGIQGI
jgi:hypothetical protein